MNPDALLEKFVALDRALVAHGFPATSPWWMSTVARFLRSGRRRLVLRVGRRGGKSSTLCRLAVLWALYVPHEIPPGDVGVVALVSVNRDESAARLTTIAKVLDVLGIAYRRTADTIELSSRPLVFRTFACTVQGSVGFTAILVLCDELSVWRNMDTGANPASEVLAWLRPTMATQPRAIEVLSSSPLGSEDAHAEAFAEGDTADQLVAHAATWTANPTITEERTHALERDEKRWRRMYAAIPSAGVSGAFDEASIDRAMRDPGPIRGYSLPVGVVDLSGGRSDSAAWGVFRYITPDAGAPHLYQDTAGNLSAYHTTEHTIVARDAAGVPLPNPAYQEEPRALLELAGVQHIDGAFSVNTPGDTLIAMMARTFRAAGVTHVVGDQFSALLAETEFRRWGLRYASIPWTNASKIEAVGYLRRVFREESIILPAYDPLRRQLLAFTEKISPSGAITFAGRGRTHDDLVALLVTFAHFELSDGDIWSTHRPSPVDGSPLSGAVGGVSSRLDA